MSLQIVFLSQCVFQGHNKTFANNVITTGQHCLPRPDHVTCFRPIMTTRDQTSCSQKTVYLTILSDDAEGVSLQEAGVELEDGRMVQLREKLSLLNGMDRLIGFQIANMNLF